MRVTVFDYGAGNLHSLLKALAGDGRSIGVETNPAAALNTDVLILPGVGAFAPAAAALAPARIAVRDALLAGLPCLGICLGMQLLCEASDEGPGEGLGVVQGRVTRLSARRVPQIGWNDLTDRRDPLLEASRLGTAYYANGYVCRVTDTSLVTSWSTHEQDRFAATVRRGRVMGVQFHPEKSSAPGVSFLRGFLKAVSQ
jgi:glutamine amidotransferase